MNKTKNCEFNTCNCSEDDNCGCSFPNNIEDYCDCTAEDNCGCMELDEEKQIHIKKDSICICTEKECDCKVERTETDK